MKITKLLLDGYNYLKFSNINKLQVDIENKVQVIIGDNGSGKSRLMAMFAARPPQSTLFSKKGGMELHMEHDNHEYVMSYDAASKHHSFLQDGIELNDSHTSGVSEELAQVHLGYNKIIDKLIFNKMRMTQMASAARMEFLTSINPINIKFMRDKYSKIVTQLKKSKAQLEMLHKRTTEYKSSMIEPESYENYTSELLQLKEFDNSIIQLMYRYTTLLSTIDTPEPKFDKDYYRDNLKKLTRFRVSLEPASSMVSYSSIEDLESQHHTATFKLNEYLLQMEQISKEIDELEQLINKTDSTPISLLEEEYCKYKTSLNSFPDFTNELIIEWPPKDPEDVSYTYLHKLTEISHQIADSYIGKIWSVKKYKFHKDRFDRMIRLRDDLNRQLSNLQLYHTELIQQSDSATRLKPDSSCVSNTCALKNRYNEVLRHELNKIKSCNTDIASITKQHTKCVKILQLYHTLLPYQDIFHHPFGIVQNTLTCIKNISSSLLTLFQNSHDVIIDIINKNHQGVMEKVKYTLKISNDYFEMINIRNKIKELDLIVQSRKKDISVEFAKNKITQNYKKLNELDNCISNIRSTITNIETTISYERKIMAGISRTSSIIADIEKDTIAYEGHAKKIMYSSIHSQLNELHQHVSDYIRDIEYIVDEQKKIRQLYSLEYSSVKKLEKHISELTVMEQALNPYTGLPSIYTRTYLDQILKNVNYIISQVFTYKLEVSLIEDVSDTKYRFNVMVHDVPAGDISCCSDGQMEIIDFAFTVSLMIALGIHKTHPLFLDEIGRCQDTTHAQKLLETILFLVNNGYINQLFIINHQAILLGGFDHADVICLRSENIMLPDSYNQKVIIN